GHRQDIRMQRQQSVGAVGDAVRGSPASLGQGAELVSDDQVYLDATFGGTAIAVTGIAIVTLLTALGHAVTADRQRWRFRRRRGGTGRGGGGRILRRRGVGGRWRCRRGIGGRRRGRWCRRGRRGGRTRWRRSLSGRSGPLCEDADDGMRRLDEGTVAEVHY